MLELEEYRLKMEGLRAQIEDLSEALGLAETEREIARLEAESGQPDFWNDMSRSQLVLQKIKQMKDKRDAFARFCRQWEDVRALIDLALEAGDESVLPEVEAGVKAVMEELERQKLVTLLSGEYDKNNTIMSFHAGAGGTEAQDWVEMLYRMYTRWAERHGFQYKILDYLEGEEAGIKSASILIEGQNAYGYMKSETGVHRLVRISPFDASGRRHTSFASVEVIPEITDDIQIEIKEEDLRVDTYRSSGAGGQHVNKTESAVRITHLPTGIVVACQNERSQHQNREVALRMLKSKLLEIKEREHFDRIEDIKGEQKDIAWGSQIRSYVFMPYTLVKDHRTGFEVGNIGAVMDGEIDGFINAYLKAQVGKK